MASDRQRAAMAARQPGGPTPDADAPPSDWRDAVYGAGHPGPDNPVLLSVIVKARRLRRVAIAAHAAGRSWREEIA